METILITGGAGYVGAVLTPKLLDLGYRVKVIDLMIYGENVIAEHVNLEMTKGDIRDQSLLSKLLVGVDYVIHLACISNDPSFDLNPELGRSINLDAFEPLVKLSQKEGVKRFVYASSSSVYGVKDVENVSEDMVLEPLTDYSVFKADCEKILANYTSDDFVTVTIRPATVCGYSPRQRLDVVVNILTNFAYHKGSIKVFGGEQLRPNIHIQDMTNLYAELLTMPADKINGEIFNAGYENQKVITLAHTVQEVLGDDITIEVEPTDDNRSYHISSQKIKDCLGFTPQFTIKDAVIELKDAFDQGLLPNALDDKRYFNIKTMLDLHLE
ncbi:MAG: SDR family oxidoreductase [Colwellia sp.]|nr:SDR family oxidoreductase [Colwellia sp.]